MLSHPFVSNSKPKPVPGHKFILSDSPSMAPPRGKGVEGTMAPPGLAAVCAGLAPGEKDKAPTAASAHSLS